MSIGAEQKKLYQDLKNVGLRAQATSAGLVQLCRELKAVGVLDDAALGRVKCAVADQIALAAHRPTLRANYQQEIMRYLDAIFSGKENVSAVGKMPYSVGVDE